MRRFLSSHKHNHHAFTKVNQLRYSSSSININNSNNASTSKINTVRVPKTLPHRDVKISIYTAKKPIDQIAITVPRLEQHYYNTVAEDMMLLTYDHFSPNAKVETLAKHYQTEWSPSLPTHHLQKVFSEPLENLPTDPYAKIGSCTNLITKKTSKEVKRHRRLFKKGNPIDTVGLSKQDLNKVEVETTATPYAPLYEYLPVLKKIQLRVVDNGAIQNKLS